MHEILLGIGTVLFTVNAAVLIAYMVNAGQTITAVWNLVKRTESQAGAR
jgi:hypothetical protein